MTPVLRARAAGQWVAGVLIVRHGTSATYLVGWSGDDGRKARATNALLWAALGELARRGCEWLDLGGIDDTATPGVAEFKRGMGGREYVLSGTYLAL
jgi:lipid II:glycine glycyltransferase (peptidoglycan interpeptide bridge formation enzyme)